jgi:ferredoxin
MNKGRYYMRTLILHFSGTGNTAYIAKILQGEFIALGSPSEILPMEELTLGRQCPDFSQYDLIGIGFPVHAMDAPQIVYDLLAMLPQGKQDYFLFKTAGSSMLHGGSTRKIREALAIKGWHLLHEQLYVMPPNMFYTQSPAKVAKRCAKAADLARQSVQDIHSGIRKRTPDTSLPGFCYGFARMEKHGARQSSRRWYASDKCTLCGLCAAKCPSENIRIEDGELVFGDSCLLCLRCFWLCPQNALSHKILKPFLLKRKFTLPD